MSALKLRIKAWERMLYSGTGMVVFVILSIIIWVIPHVINDTTPGTTPERAVPAFWVLVAIHLVVLAVLIGKIVVSRRGGRFRKTWLVISGIILILISLPLLDAAGAYLGHHAPMSSVAILLFLCVACDIIAGIIAILLPSRLPE